MTLDKQTAMKFEKMKSQILELEKRLAAHELAMRELADRLDVEIDLTPVETEAEKFSKQRLERSSKALLASDEVKAYLEEAQREREQLEE